MAHDVFISHSSKDKAVADAACAELETRGIRCWVAPRDITPGESWPAAIIRGINGAKLMVLIYSAHANRSKQIQREVERAANRGIPLLPLRIEDVPPTPELEYFMSTPHWLDALTPPLEAHLRRMADTVQRLLGQSPNEGSPSQTTQPTEKVTSSGSGWAWAMGAAVIAAAIAAGSWYGFYRTPPVRQSNGSTLIQSNPENTQPAAQPVDPQAALAEFDAANTHLAREEYKEAIEGYDRALKQNPGLVNARVNRGVGKVRMLDWAAGEADFEQSHKLDPHSAAAAANLALSRAQAGNMSEAVDYYAKAAAISPDDLALELGRANVLARAGRSDEAMAEYLSARKLDPWRPGLNVSIAQTALAAGKYDAALEACSWALSRNRNNAQAYYLQAQAKYQRDQKNPPTTNPTSEPIESTAQQDYDKALELDPSLASQPFYKAPPAAAQAIAVDWSDFLIQPEVNLVEPLENGPPLTLTRDQLNASPDFGPLRSETGDTGTPLLYLNVGRTNVGFWPDGRLAYISLGNGDQLHCGLGPRMSDVFGQNARDLQDIQRIFHVPPQLDSLNQLVFRYDQYELTFFFISDHLGMVTVSPCEGLFRDAKPRLRKPWSELLPPVKLAVSDGNLVEPLSNWLLLNSTRKQVMEKFGVEVGNDLFSAFDSPDFVFNPTDSAAASPGWTANADEKGDDAYLSRVKITGPQVRLNCGVGIHTPRVRVRQVFGNDQQVEYDQYTLHFAYRNGCVAAMEIAGPQWKERFHAYDSMEQIAANQPMPAGQLPNASDRIQPLSNGLRLEMNRERIEQRFGKPDGSQEDVLSYPGTGLSNDFQVKYDESGRPIWIALQPGVQLHCGISGNSTRDQARAALGSPDRERSSQEADWFVVGDWNVILSYNAHSLWIDRTGGKAIPIPKEEQ